MISQRRVASECPIALGYWTKSLMQRASGFVVSRGVAELCDDDAPHIKLHLDAVSDLETEHLKILAAEADDRVGEAALSEPSEGEFHRRRLFAGRAFRNEGMMNFMMYRLLSSMPRGIRPSFAAAVHPRTHGEHLIIDIDRNLVLGSSPHARGTWRIRGCQTCLVGFIPARTGNIFVSAISGRRISVHPRTHGEHQKSHIFASNHLGSSPHARGTFGIQNQKRSGWRFIPARTGNIEAPSD